MGMGIAAGGLAVGGPAGVGNAYGAADVFVAAILCKIVYLTFRLINVKTAVAADERHARRVVTTILQAAQTFN